MKTRIQSLAGYSAALGLTALATGLVALVRAEFDVSTASMLYLLAVLAAAVFFGTRPAIFAAIAAFLSYDFFFVRPYYTFTVSDGDEWIALGLLLITGLITGQLAAALRERALDAERREREAVVLYDVLRLMGEPELQRSLTAVAERLRSELDMAAAVVIFGKDSPVRAQADIGDPEAVALAHQVSGASSRVLVHGAAPSGSTRGAPGRWIRVVSPSAGHGERVHSDRVLSVPVRLNDQHVGSIILVRRRDAPRFSGSDDRLLSTVAHQLSRTVERLRLQTEANEAEALRRTDELRSALINAVSHDLRTPLSSIIASAGSLLQSDVTWSEDDKQDFARTIVEEAERLDRLVGNLLDLSRIEAGSIRPAKGWYDLGSLVNEVAGRLRRVTAGHPLTIDVPDGLPPVNFDYVEIDQVLTNLIENAAKYTPAGAEIRVAVRSAPGEVSVDVMDSGPGIPVGAEENLFKPFYRAGAGQQPPGSGLGLAVAKGLVEAHDGRIWAENRPEGGARFVFTLPATDHSEAAA